MTASTSSSMAVPTIPGERLRSLDVLRGFAVLGILIMNIQSFSMISAAYINPTAYGDLSGANLWVWIVSHVLAADKFMSIFSMLFGAGIVLMAERIEAAGGKPGRVHYRRMFWLLLFGLAHAYLIWYGDILVAYSLCGMLVFAVPPPLAREARRCGVVLLRRPGTPVRDEQLQHPVLAPGIVCADAALVAAASRGRRPRTQRDAKRMARADADAHDGAIFLQTFLFLFLMFWRVMSMMLLGMALYKWGVLAAKRSRAFYFAAVPLRARARACSSSRPGVQRNFAAGWKMDFSMFLGYCLNYVGSVGVALGLHRAGDAGRRRRAGRRRCRDLLAGVGRMAFSNYILMSLLAMFIFYGNGLGLFGSVERVQQALLVPAIWAVVLVVTPLWLSKFRYGPLEWLWRTLTYLKRQPLVSR